MNHKSLKTLALFLSLMLMISSCRLNVYAATTPVKNVSISNYQSGVKIKWTAAKDGGYRIYKKTSKNGEWKKLADTEKSYYIDTNVKSNKRYYYSVKHYRGKKRVYSARSKTVSQHYVAAPIISAGYEAGGAACLDIKNISDRGEYIVYRKVGKDGSFSQLKSAELTCQKTESVRDMTVKSGKTYYYKVRYLRSGTKSAYSKTVKIQCRYYAGVCARNGHETLHKVKTVEPTEVLSGYTVYACSCGMRRSVRNIKKATGNPAPHAKEYAYEESVKRHKAALKYIDKVRQNDKVDLLQVINGTEDEIRVLKKQSDIICSGCDTNYEKYLAIYNWVINHVQYDINVSSAPFEVLRQKRGDCQGMSRLMVDLLRLQNIPSVSVIGYMGDMKTILTEENMLTLSSSMHQWVLAYCGKNWVFADAVTQRFDPAAKFDIPAWYYTVSIDYAVAYYEGMNLKIGTAYPTCIDGKYYHFGDNGRQSFNSFTTLSDDFSYSCMVLDNVAQQDNPQSFTNYQGDENMRPGRVFTNGEIISRTAQRFQDESFIGFAYYNGRIARETVFTAGGKKYLNEYVTYSNYSGKYLATMYGYPVLQVGETMKLGAVYTTAGDKNVWSSSNKSVIKVDQSGTITAQKTGYAEIRYTPSKSANYSCSIMVYVVNDTVHKIKAADMAPASDIKVQRSKLYQYLKNFTKLNKQY